jgi:hypothetical protein
MVAFTTIRSEQQIAAHDLESFRREVEKIAIRVFGETSCEGIKFEPMDLRRHKQQIIVVTLLKDQNISEAECEAFMGELLNGKWVDTAHISQARFLIKTSQQQDGMRR